MTLTEYRRTTLAQMRPRQYRTLVPVRNGWAEIAAGTLVKVTGKRDGLVVETGQCECCGVKVRMTHVRPQEIEEVPGMIARSETEIRAAIETLRETPGAISRSATLMRGAAADALDWVLGEQGDLNTVTSMLGDR